MDIRQINDRLSVSPQISCADIDEIKRAGFKTVVSNRPDGEAPDQPMNADIEAAVKAAGLDFFHVPVTVAPFSDQSLAQTRKILEEAKGPILFFCRTGTRCTHLWAFSQKGKVPGSELIEQAFDAGYNISRLADELG